MMDDAVGFFWNDRVRYDGVSVRPDPNSLEGAWIIVSTLGEAIRTCPCCAKTIPTQDIAKRLADRLFKLGPVVKS